MTTPTFAAPLSLPPCIASAPHIAPLDRAPRAARRVRRLNTPRPLPVMRALPSAAVGDDVQPSPLLVLGEDERSGRAAARVVETPVEETLRLLDWPAVSAQVARHAATELAEQRLRRAGGMQIPASREESERLLTLTRAVHYLYFTLMKTMDFRGICAVDDTLMQAEKGVLLTAAELRRIADTLAAARRIRRFIDAEEDERLLVLKKLVSDVRTYPEVESKINKLIDDFSQVVDTFDPPLREIRADIRATSLDINSRLNRIMSSHAEALQERVITMRYDRFVIPVKTPRKGIFKRSVVHDVSASGGTTYLEPAAVRHLNDRLRMLAAKERARINKVLRELSDLVAPLRHDVAHLSEVVCQLDVAAAKASASHELDAVDVQFDDTNPLRLLGVRHPLLSWRAMTQAHSTRPQTSSEQTTESEEPLWKRDVIPTSYELSDGVRCVCVTGPNTGGKTLALKTLGVSVLMAKAGMFVPGMLQRSGDDGSMCARIPYFNNVLADIGDDQSLVQSLSTFSGHVERIKRILAASTPETLVLLDEIGSGTDPAEGAALGMSILRHLAVGQRAALTFATTHHGELKTLKYAKDNSALFFENASVEFDDVNMVPTYRLIWGIPVIEEARFLLKGGDGENGDSSRVDIEKMISSLERDKNAAEAAREDTERALREAKTMRSELEGRLHRLRENEAQLRKDQKSAMELEVKQAKKQIAKVIREMQKGGGSAQAAGRATEKLGKMKVPGAETSPSQVVPSGSVNVDDVREGDKVIVPRLSANEVEVVQKLSKKELMVAIGAMKAKVKVEEVASVNQRKAKHSNVTSKRRRGNGTGNKQLNVRTAANTIDIRGQRVDSAQPLVDRAISKALAMGTLWVIHGHGTGRLRDGVREFLSQHELVERISYAEQEDGGTGVTIAFLQ
ncbi:Endonuclease MutS2 [Gracilaria domingensis]|nr:Endonuclease MutS2 [Gracilaria domingensis]